MTGLSEGRSWSGFPALERAYLEALPVAKEGEARRTYEIMHRFLVDPRIETDSSERRAVYDAWAALVYLLDGSSTVFSSIVDHPDDPDRLREAAIWWSKQELPVPSIPLLRARLQLRPNATAVRELALLLMSCDEAGLAKTLLESRSETTSEIHLRSLHARACASVGDIQVGIRFVEEEKNDAEDPFAREVFQFVARAGAVKSKPFQETRYWQWVINGVLVLRPADADEEGGGLFAAAWDQGWLIGEGLAYTKAILTAANRIPERILSVPDRDAQILAYALAETFGVPVEPWVPEEKKPGLLAVFSVDKENLTAEQEQFLHTRDPSLLVWAYAHNWTRDVRVAPDIVVALAQNVTPPWASQMKIEGDPMGPPPRKVTHTPADERPPSEIGKDLANWRPTEPVTYPDPNVVEFAKACLETWSHPGTRPRFLRATPLGGRAFFEERLTTVDAESQPDLKAARRRAIVNAVASLVGLLVAVSVVAKDPTSPWRWAGFTVLLCFGVYAAFATRASYLIATGRHRGQGAPLPDDELPPEVWGRGHWIPILFAALLFVAMSVRVVWDLIETGEDQTRWLLAVLLLLGAYGLGRLARRGYRLQRPRQS